MQISYQAILTRGCSLHAVLLIVALFASSSEGVADELDGDWSGKIMLGDNAGDIALTVRRYAEGYTAECVFIPLFDGPLLSIEVRPGNEPNTTTFKAVSRTTQISSDNYARLRFYLVKKRSGPQLYGVIELDRDFGEDLDFTAVLEQQPCCHSACILKEGCPNK